MQLETEAVNFFNIPSELLIKTLDSSSIGLIAFNSVTTPSGRTELRFSFFNNTASEILSTTFAEMINKSPECFPELFDNEMILSLSEVCSSGKKLEKEVLYSPRDANKWLKINLFKWNESVIVTMENITQKKTAEVKQSESTAKELQKINKELEECIKERNVELVMSEKRYRSLALATSSVVWLTNGSGQIEIESKSWENFTGQNFEQYQKFGWLRAIHNEDRKSQKKVWSEAFLNKKTIDIEFRLKRFDNEYRYVQVRVVPVLDEENKLVEWIGTCADIHDKKVAEAALIESEHRYEIAMKVTHDVIWDWNLASNTISYTENYFANFGYNPDNRSSPVLEWYKKVHPDDSEGVLESLKEAIKAGEKFWFQEYRHQRSDGTYADVFDRGHIIYNEQNNAVRIVGAMVDITTRKKVEESLKISEGNLKEAQKISKLGNWSWDLKTNTFLWSEEMFNIYEREISEEPNYLFLQTSHIYDPKLSEKISNAINYGTSFQVDTAIKVKSGIKHVQIIGKAETAENGECKRIYGTSMDITDRKKSEEKLEALLKETQVTNEKLVKMNEVLDSFVYAAAHDLRSPVANLKLILSLIQTSEDIIKIKKHLNDFTSSINRLDNTIRGLVEVIEIQSNQEDMAKVVSFRDAIESIKEELKNEIEQKNCDIKTDIDNCSEITYIEPYLMSILRNLISNALKYSRQGIVPEIQISTDREGEFVKLIIEDNGIGMDLERYGKNLFKPFTRFTKDVDGKGLGLHLIKNMIEKNKGKINVTSYPNQGTTFINYLKEYR